MLLANVIGGMLLLHAGYSSYEHHQLLKHASLLPLDVVLELIIAIILLNFGTIESLRNTPRQGVVYGDLVEPKKMYLKPIGMSEAMELVNQLGVTEHEELDSRVDFMDVRAKRKEYLEWEQSEQ